MKAMSGAEFMKYEYKIQTVDFQQVNTQSNTLGQQSWELVILIYSINQ
jgi:hypothetical protein